MIATKQKSSGKGNRLMTQTGTSQGVMHGKKGLIMGVANDRSIAWGIAAKLAEQGAEFRCQQRPDNSKITYNEQILTA